MSDCAIFDAFVSNAQDADHANHDGCDNWDGPTLDRPERGRTLAYYDDLDDRSDRASAKDYAAIRVREERDKREAIDIIAHYQSIATCRAKFAGRACKVCAACEPGHR